MDVMGDSNKDTHDCIPLGVRQFRKYHEERSFIGLLLKPFILQNSLPPADTANSVPCHPGWLGNICVTKLGRSKSHETGLFL
jgi:hypothetical protein